jgi:hypothetical protein
MNALRKPLEPTPDPKAEAALAASMERLRKRVAEADERMTQGSGMVPRGAHNPERSGSIPAPATDQMRPATPNAETETGLPPVASDVPSTPKPRLVWMKPEGMSVKTECKRYSCSKVILNGKPTYEVWAMVPSGNWFNCLERGLESFERAKVIAQEHADR